MYYNNTIQVYLYNIILLNSISITFYGRTNRRNN